MIACGDNNNYNALGSEQPTEVIHVPYAYHILYIHNMVQVTAEDLLRSVLTEVNVETEYQNR